MKRFAQRFISGVLSYLVLPAVIFIGLILHESPLALLVTGTAAFLIWKLCSWIDNAIERNGPRSVQPRFTPPKTAPAPNRARRAHTPRPKQHTGPRSAGAQRKGHTQQRTRARQSFTDPNFSDAAFYKPEEPLQPQHERFDGDPFNDRRGDEDWRCGSRSASWFDKGEERSTREDPGEDIGKWIRGDPPYDHHRDFNH